jgi:hypothetical protein
LKIVFAYKEKNLIYSGFIFPLILQISTSTTLIDDPERQQAFLQIISDQFSMKIISSIIPEAKTAVQIGKETHIPISTVYRRLQLLQENKMVKISGGINKVGKFFVYQSKIREISTSFDGKSMRIYVTPNINFTIV